VLIVCVKETNARKEFLMKQTLLEEQIKFTVAADPFNVGNLAKWFKAQFRVSSFSLRLSSASYKNRYHASSSASAAQYHQMTDDPIHSTSTPPRVSSRKKGSAIFNRHSAFAESFRRQLPKMTQKGRTLEQWQIESDSIILGEELGNGGAGEWAPSVASAYSVLDSYIV
jgi:hypothetical protein